MIGPDILDGKARQFSIDRRMNEVKAALCDAIKCRSKDLVAQRIFVQPKRQCLLKSPSDLRIYLRRQHLTFAISRERVKAALVAAENVDRLYRRLCVDFGDGFF